MKRRARRGVPEVCPVCRGVQGCAEVCRGVQRGAEGCRGVRCIYTRGGELYRRAHLVPAMWPARVAAAPLCSRRGRCVVSRAAVWAIPWETKGGGPASRGGSLASAAASSGLQPWVQQAVAPHTWTWTWTWTWSRGCKHTHVSGAATAGAQGCSPCIQGCSPKCSGAGLAMRSAVPCSQSRGRAPREGSTRSG